MKIASFASDVSGVPETAAASKSPTANPTELVHVAVQPW